MDPLQPLWRPPSWWDAGSNVNDPSNHRLIKNAYAKAETCRQCRNFIWPPEGRHFSIERMSKLDASAQRGCAGCMLMRSISTLIQYHLNGIRRPHYAFVSKYRFEQSRLMVYSLSDFNCEVYSPDIQDHIWKIPHFPKELQVSSYTGSIHAIKRTQLWLRECEETHESCEHSNSPLPSRVLFIQGPQNVTLLESKGETAPYACLSHCWGKKHIIRTTTATLPRYKRSISWKQLPLTFRHAVSFTYRLGLKYLWIDSLCIVQDDVEDWRNEGSKMAQIYSGAYITLAATASRDASGGCFRHTPDRPVFHLPFPDGKGSKSHLCIRPGMKDLGFSHAPLLKRAWTLQERLLSPRTLHFTHNELVWECRTTHDCECSIQRSYGNRPSKLDSSWLNHRLSIDNDNIEPHVWWSVIEQYSQQRLTYEKDIFPALQGISKIFFSYKKSRFLAGLWEESLISDLLWIHCTSKGCLKEWRAPSWSWASVLGVVSWGSRSDAAYFYPLVTCTAAEVELAGTDAFGEILSATITLHGRCLPQAVQEPLIDLIDAPDSRVDIEYPNDPVWEALITSIVVCPDRRTSESSAKRPYSKAFERGTCFKTVVMAKKVSPFESCSFLCLALRKLDANSNTYERVAFVRMDAGQDIDASMLPLDEEETFCIV